MSDWRSVLKYNPIPALLATENKALIWFTEKDLLSSVVKNPDTLWELPEAQKIVNRQQPDGSWNYPGQLKKQRSRENYNQFETYRNLGYLVEMFAFDKRSPVIEKAAAFLFGFQSDAGDFRGIYGNQYTPNYTAGIMELLIKAGFDKDPRIEKAFAWLKSIRQNDGGWAIPFRTLHKPLGVIISESRTLEPGRTEPFSHLVTGVVLRAYAAHKEYRNSDAAQKAGKLLMSRFFIKDSYSDRGSPAFWLKFTFPFWFTDLISALDSISRLGFSKDEPQIRKALEWFISSQQKNGTWELYALKNQRYDPESWLAFCICRILKRWNP
jgi:hypothetical protein